MEKKIKVTATCTYYSKEDLAKAIDYIDSVIADHGKAGCRDVIEGNAHRCQMLLELVTFQNAMYRALAKATDKTFAELLNNVK